MIRVLQILGTIGLGGAESRVMDLYRHMDRDNIQFDFLVTEGTGEYFKAEIEELGGRIYYLPAFRIVNYAVYKRACTFFFKSHSGEGISEYAVAHGHMTSTASIYLPIAKRQGVSLTIAHARSAGTDPGIKGVATSLMRRDLYKCCDMALACSDEAGEAVFGMEHDYVFMPNAIDTADFAYDEEERIEIRRQFGIADDELLIGHVGSFRYAKNHEFVIEVAKSLYHMKEALGAFSGKTGIKLMLVGDGDRRAMIESLVKTYNMEDYVIFAGDRSPVSPFYQAFDILLFPSHYEGMPGSVVEAQAAGLPCLISDAITKQVIYTDRVKQLPLSAPPDVWAKELISMAGYPADGYRSNVTTLSGGAIADTMYDVHSQVRYYTALYTEAAERHN